MATKQFACLACGSGTTVDTEQDTHRCASCGTKYTGPWDSPTVERSPVPESEWAESSGQEPTPQATATDGGQDADSTIQLDAGDASVTVTITVEVEPGS